jgi:hypothetical protein
LHGEETAARYLSCLFIIAEIYPIVKPEKENVLYVAQNAEFPRHSADYFYTRSLIQVAEYLTIRTPAL